DTKGRRFTTAAGTVVAEGDVISVDGTAGKVYLGELDVVPSPVVDYFEGRRPPERDALLRAVDRIIHHADHRARLDVRANADTPEDAHRARALGASGIGLVRTEHMFLGDRRVLVERLILAADDDERADALAALLPLQRADFTRILEEMDGLPVTIRLLDPPLHEFLPDRTELTARVAVAKALGQHTPDEDLLAAVDRLHEENPMLGTRGVRLGLVIPGLYDLQVRAIAEATAARIRAFGDPRVEIMIPLIGDVRELEITAARAREVVAEVAAETGVAIPYEVGTMIELPRAALTAGRIAETARFFSFGTNDLTQTTWGFSRDDVEGSFFPAYLEQGVFDVSPFETIDRDGVGRLVTLAAREGRVVRPDLELGVCGEHGGDPASIHFFHDIGLDYVSCSPFRVPVARLEAGRAAVGETTNDTR
ncbi:putative PEP-binding protein, partial [Actinophytocola sp.]|uniref:putative PEP-binding protein n=1 Tax=Actinophytocola sp. TaxID=1872138 RepID=UPI002D5C98DA